MLSAQGLLVDCLVERRLRTVCSLQKYDSAFVDAPPPEREAALSAIHDAFRNPPLVGRLRECYGRTVPVGYEIKEFVSGSLVWKGEF